jgi:amidohydrolase/N-acyl-D-amino-acid deacylase
MPVSARPRPRDRRTPSYDLLVRGALLVDGSGGRPATGDLAVSGARIATITAAGSLDPEDATQVVEAAGLALAPGFIDVHTHDDTVVVRAPDMAPKISQGVTTVVVGNCGISAAPVVLRGDPPDPMNLLGRADAFRYPSFAAYVDAVDAARPTVNVAALVGHTALRSNHLDRLDRAATTGEIDAMRAQLAEALAGGALGLSTGLAYGNAAAAPTGEVVALAEPLADAGGIYCTHLRSEGAGIREALDEAFEIGRRAGVPVLVSHLKCAGVANYGRSTEVLGAIERAAGGQSIGWDCYPYTASSSTLDLGQVTDEIEIVITWSDPHPEASGLRLADLAATWEIDLLDAARRLQPAGAVYHCMADEDVERILRHPGTAIGSDGLPEDPLPHPRLWGAFPRVLGRYVRERGLLSLADAVRKMTGLSADRFGLGGRGYLREGFAADLVLFDPAAIRDTATFTSPQQPAEGIAGVWVAGVMTWQEGVATGERAGRFLRRGASSVEGGPPR